MELNIAHSSQFLPRKLKNSLNELFRSPQTSESTTSNVNKMIVDILPHVLSLTEAVLFSCRSSVLYQMHETSEPAGKYSLQDYLVLDGVISMASANWAMEASLVTLLPNSVKSVLDKWKAINLSQISWVNYHTILFYIHIRTFLF